LVVTDEFLEMAEDKAVLPPQFCGKPGTMERIGFAISNIIVIIKNSPLRKSWLSLNF